MKRSLVFVFALLFLLASACADAGSVESVEIPSSEEVNTDVLPNDTILRIAYLDQLVEVRIQYPKGKMIGTLLILQGWNFPNTDWCEKTTLCSKALQEGYALVCPDMGKSTYSEEVYAQTRKDWLIYPTRAWLVDEMLPALQKFHLFREGELSAIVGLSTGARGAFLVAQDRPELFGAVACLSGDYDQSKFPDDNLYKGFFGELSRYPEQWNEKENPMSRIDQFKAALYLGHGTTDEVVDIQHSDYLVEALKSRKYEKLVYHRVEGFGHDYSYWNSEVDAVLDFFKKQQ